MRIDKVSTTQPLVIRLPDGKVDKEHPFDWTQGTETDMVLQCVSMESAPVRTAGRKIHKENLGKKEEDIPLEVQDRQHAELYASAVLDWSGVENADGPVPYSHEKVVEYLQKPELRFVFEQVQIFVSERAKFFPRNNEPTGRDGPSVGKDAVKKQPRIVAAEAA